MTDVAQIVAGLTKAQAAMVLESEPGAWGRDDDGTGAEVFGSGYIVARNLVAANLGDIEEHPGLWPPALYFNNALGLAVRTALLSKDGDSADA